MTCLVEKVALDKGQEHWQPGLREGAELVKSGPETWLLGRRSVAWGIRGPWLAYDQVLSSVVVVLWT